MITDTAEREREREALMRRYGEVWNYEDAQRDFHFSSVQAPVVNVRRREDNIQGTLEFQQYPRFYFNFTPQA